MQSSEKKWPVQSISKWKHSSNTWEDTPYKEGCCCLLIKATQLLIIETIDTVSTVVESVCLFGSGGEVKAKYRNENVGIQVMKSQGNLAQFIKIRLASSLEKSALDNCTEVVDELKRFIVFTNHPKQKENNSEVIVKSLQQVIRDILNPNPTAFKDSELVLLDDCIEQTVGEYFLDPGCLAFLEKIGEILKNIEEED